MESKIERIIGNIETILDILIILIIIITTAYTTWKKEKNNNGEDIKYIDSETYIDKQEGFVTENSIQENIKKYQDFKGFIKAFFATPSIIICSFLFLVILYGIITNQGDSRSPLFLLLFFGSLLFYIISLIKTKNILDKYENNFFYNIIKIFIALVISTLVAALRLFTSNGICSKLKINIWLGAIVIIFPTFILRILSLCLIVKILFPKKKSHERKLCNELGNNEIKKTMYNNKENNDNKEKIGFQHKSLLK